MVQPPRFFDEDGKSAGLSTPLTSSAMRKQVIKAWAIQRSRYQNFPGIRANGDMTAGALRTYCSLTGEAQSLFESAVRQFHISGRGVTRVLRVARTIADLGSSDKIDSPHLLEALTLRGEEDGGA